MTNGRSLAWRDACKLLGTQPVSVDGQWERGLSASGTTGVQFADVEVDIETGVTRVRKIVCVQDCGLIVDLKTAETQCYGGIISGVNYAVLEERILDRNTANMVNPNMEFYLIAGQSDIPEIDVVLVDQPERGVIGIGEPPAVATAAAIANAVRNATGVTIRSIPITPGQAAHRARARGRDELKAFAYVNAANEKEAVAALGTERGRFLPMAGGMDLLGLMKDFIVSPERVVNVKNLDATIAAADGGLRIGAAVKLADLAEHAGARKLYPALTTAAEEVGTPQIRNMGTVGGNIMQRPRCWYFSNEEFHCLKKGGSRCYAVEGENQYHAIFGDGPCHIVHPSSLAVPVIAYGGRFRVVGPSGAREVDAGEFFQLPNVNLYGETVLQPNEIVTHVILPPPGQRSASYEVRFKQSHDWPLALASVNLVMDGATVQEGASRDGRRGADSMARPGGRARARGGKTIAEAVRRRRHPWPRLRAPRRSAATPTRFRSPGPPSSAPS